MIPIPTVEESIARIDPDALAPGPAAQPFSGNPSEWNQARSLECLTSAVYYEARSESEEGQRAVAQVVLNRVRHPAFPNSVCGVVYQGSQRRTGCQFTFTCDGSLARRPEPSGWARARLIAADALSGSVSERVGLATHYHTSAISPWWAPRLQRAVQVGSHIFYRWRGQWGDPISYRQGYAAAEPGIQAPIRFAENQIGSTSSVAGVTIHRGGPQTLRFADSGGVRIHRASSRPVPAEPATESAPEQSLTGAESAGLLTQ